MADRRRTRPSPRARVKSVVYTPPDDYPYGVELVVFDELRRRVERNDARGVERVDFHCLIHVSAGRYRHMVDFEHFECGAGSVLLVRPGQVHRFGDLVGRTGWMIVFRSEEVPTTGGPEPRAHALESFRRLADAPPLVLLPASSHRAVSATITQMAEDTALDAPRPLIGALLRSQLEALLLRLELAHPQPSAEPAAAPEALARLRQFEELVEREFRSWHGIGRYARRLQCSEKTLARAALAIRGKTAKALLTDRLTLEAKRLLVHSASSVAAIAEALGFEEATNFVKFFKRETRVTPGAFRRQQLRSS
jgi:AraC-like DNA-binding protein